MNHLRFAAVAVAFVCLGGTLASADVVGRAISTSPDILTNFVQADPDYDMPGDMFGIRNRLDPDPPNSIEFPGLPFAIADDSLINFPGDTQGIIKDQDNDDFFGVVDTVNGNGNDANVATWTFDISTVTSALMVSIDMAAMGDFEDSDLFDFDYQIDGGGFFDLFTSAFVDTNDAANGDGQAYTMEDTTVVVLDDPMEMNGTRLTNDFQSLAAAIAGTGSTLDLRFTANTNGGLEAFAFRNVSVEGSIGGGGQMADFDNDGDVDGDDFLTWQASFGVDTGGDADGDGDTDGDDFLIWQAEFGASGASSNAAVPEPAALMLLIVLGVAIVAVRMRNG